MDPAGAVRVGLRRVEFRTLVREPGQPAQVSELTGMPAKSGNRILLVQGTTNPRRWPDPGIASAIGIRNLSSGEIELRRQAIAALAVPPFNNFFGILSIFVALFSLLGLVYGSPTGIVFLILSVGYLLWVKARIKKVRRAVEAILEKGGA